MADHEPLDNNTTEANTHSLPARIRVHALAKLLGLTSKEVIAKAAELGTEVRSAHSTLPRAAAEELLAAHDAPAEISGAAAPAEISGAAAPTEISGAAAPAEVPAPQDETAPVGETGAVESHSIEPAATAPVQEPQVGGPTGLFTSVEDTTPLFELPDPVPAVDSVVAAPLFLQPELPAAPAEETTPRTTRRRRSRSGAAKADEQTVADKTTEEPAVEQPAAVEASAAEEGSTDTSGPAETGTDDQDEHPRRRRRGRRGRGRGRGESADTEQQDETTPGQDESDADGAADTDNAAHTDDATDTDNPSDSGTEPEADADSSDDDESSGDDDGQSEGSSRRRRRRRRRRGSGEGTEVSSEDDPPNTVIHEREPRTRTRAVKDEVQGISGSTRLEAKRQRRRDGREAGRRRPPILTESEFLARREAVERVMVVRERTSGDHAGMTQVAVLEDGVLVEHFVTSANSASMVGNIYLGRVQNVLPSMEAAFIDIGRGRNGVLYAGEVNWEAAGLGGNSRKIEQALKPGDQVVVQVSKDPVGHKGARLTTQISLAGRFLVYVPGGTSTGISRKLPDTERKRLKDVLREIVPADAGVIIRTAAEGVSEEELAHDVSRLQSQWESVQAQAEKAQAEANGQPKTLYEEPDLLVKVVRDLFNEDFGRLVIEGDKSWNTVENYIRTVASDLLPRVERYRTETSVDVFGAFRIDEQLAKALDRKVWLPSGGTLVIDRTEAMTVIDVNTGKFTGAGGNLEETVTRNNLEAAEEVVRQMRLRDIGGMIVVDFIDMVLESNRDLVLRRLTEALGRDRTRHQVSEVTSLGLVQMTRKRLGTGLVEAFSTTCEHCHGRGIIVHADPVDTKPQSEDASRSSQGGSRRKRGRDRNNQQETQQETPAVATDDTKVDDAAKSDEAAKRAAHPVALAMAAASSVASEDEPVAEVKVASPLEAAEPEKIAEVAAEVREDTAREDVVVAAAAEVSVAEVSVAEVSAPASVEPSTDGAAPRRRRARRVARAAAAPAGDSTQAPTVFVIPTPEPTPEPVAVAAAPSGAAAEEPVIERRPRRRRAAGRPAGPPVDTEE